MEDGLRIVVYSLIEETKFKTFLVYPSRLISSPSSALKPWFSEITKRYFLWVATRGILFTNRFRHIVKLQAL